MVGTVSDKECMIYRKLKPRWTTKMELLDLDISEKEIEVRMRHIWSTIIVGVSENELFQSLSRVSETRFKLQKLLCVIFVNKRESKKSWRLLEQINPNQKKIYFNLNDWKSLKIIARKRDKFKVEFSNVHCPLPVGAKLGNCSEKQDWLSFCTFQCDEPDYIPIKANRKPYFAYCRKNRTWSAETGKYCISMDKVVKNCLSVEATKTDCPYDDDFLLDLFPEPDIDKEEEPWLIEMLAEISRTENEDIDLTIGGTKTFVVERGIFRTSVIRDCLEYCLRSRRTRRFILKCGNWQLSSSRKRDCLMCRHVYKVCRKRFIFV
uniref:uncharacterized protein LOC120348259 isoform X1 n=1 Tax=Styela clava TaxID=7725 RepID=UPI00193A77D7|nr:uncharacterized protein LOC120348259 isoform X1 [Styela clava]